MFFVIRILAPKPLIFATPADAIAFYRQTHPSVPLRIDGKPNRPLTAYTIEIVPVLEVGVN